MVAATRNEDCICEVSIGTEPRVLTVRVPVSIPTSVCPVELAHRLIQHHNLPIYLHNGNVTLFFNDYAVI